MPLTAMCAAPVLAVGAPAKTGPSRKPNMPRLNMPIFACTTPSYAFSRAYGPVGPNR